MGQDGAAGRAGDSAGTGGRFNSAAFGRKTVATIEAQVDRTVAMLSDLSPADWDRPTACTEWSLRMVVAHLVDLALNYARSVALGQRGTPTPFLGENVADAAAYRQLRRAQMTDLAPAPPRVLVDRFASEWDVANGYFKGLVAKAIAFDALGGNPPPLGAEDTVGVNPLQALAWHATGDWPAVRFIGMALFELAIHDWDMRVTADPDAQLAPDIERALLTFVRQWPTFLVRNRRLDGVAGGVRIRLGGTEPDLDVGVRNGEMVARVESPSATIHTNPTTFLLVGSGRRTSAEADTRKAWRVTGDAEVASQIIGCYRGL